MTSQGVKFYKFSNSTTSADRIALAKAVEGAIIYIVDAKELWIGGATAAAAQLVIKGANDVTFSNNVLTLTHYDNAGTATTQTLDFSDVASAQATFAVFDRVYTLMGATDNQGGTAKELDYSGTNYLSDLGGQDKPAKNLVNADKALDAAIHGGTTMAADSAAVYDTEHLSSTWTTVVEANEIKAGDAVTADVEKLDKKVAQLANEVIANEQVTNEAFTAVANSVGLESDMSLNLTGTEIIGDDDSVKEALIDLVTYVTTEAGKVDDVKINNTSIVLDKIADIAVEGTYNASTNKIATQSTVSDAIEGLDVTGYEQAEIDTTTTGQTTLTIKGIKEEDGEIAADSTNDVDVVIDGTYNTSTNKIATQSTVSKAIDDIAGAGLAVDNAGVITATTQSAGDNTTNVATTAFVKNAIDALDTQSDVQPVVYTAADSSNGAKLTFKGVSETDGVIAQGAGNTELQFAKVATTGAASDVSIVDAQSKITATNVEDALTELATNIENLVGGMRYNGDISSATATLNTSTNDIRPGDIYLASGAFSIGSTSVEAGDMIVYKGTKSTSTVALDNNNCTIIEKETDTMVTAGDTLADDYIVFGNGNKEVTTTSTVDSANYTVSAATLKDAITKANSALQSISHGSDGTYVTTTIGTKDSNNDQTVGVAVQQATVTYTATSGSTGPDLSVASGNEGLLNSNAIAPIKNYVDDKVSNVVSDLDVPEYAQATINTTTSQTDTTITIKGIKEEDGEISGTTTNSDVNIEVNGTYNASTNKIATQSTVTNAISALDADITSQQAAVATVQVVEADGVITTVNVTNVSAGVQYAQSTASTAPNLTATTSTGAVTGADIATIKSYVDDAATLRWEEYE